jgi:structural maintenance of chromosome 2
MHIKEVIIDGFKSYANRTVVSGFDPYFNAITGLNGTGKSNILDSICFVLGISNLSQVRAANLRDLIYKQGQGGVKKASVSLVFDNKDKKQSPIGFEQYDEITVTREVAVGGKNKYMINGHVAQQQRVQNLFHSVQLNVNNPHFLIMQGRITKVLNMKPPEILAMIEEAAGTRMFEMKKQNALKTIMKKQHKVDEINKVLAEEITPQLEKLREESQLFMQWSSNNVEIERLDRFCVAHMFHEAEMMLKKSGKENRSFQKNISELNGEVQSCDSQIAALNEKTQKLLKQKMSSSEGEYAEIEEEVDSISKEIVKRTAIVQNFEKVLSNEKLSISDLESQRAILGEQISSQKQDLESKQRNLAIVEKELQSHISAKSSLEGQQLGFNLGDGADNGSLVQQKMEASALVKTLESNGKSLKIQIDDVKDSIVSKKKQLKLLEKEFAEESKHASKLKESKADLEKKLGAINYKPDSLQEVLKSISTTENEARSMKDELNALKAQLSNIEFTYECKNKGGKIYGRVVNLFEVSDQKFVTALEVSAGGRLFNVVVDSESTGHDILKNAKLASRVNIIPLNRIEASEIAPQKVHLARELVGEGNVTPAISCVSYNGEIESAIKYVFGSNFICASSDDAKKVTFHKGINVKSVTVEGDVFSPVGTLTGGSRASNSSIIEKMNVLRNLEKNLASKLHELEKLNSTKNKLQTQKKQFQDVKEELDLVSHKLNLAQATLDKTDYRAAEMELQSFNERLKSFESEYTEAIKVKNVAQGRLQELQARLSELENGRENAQSTIEKELKKLKKEIDISNKRVSELQHSTETCMLELQNLEHEDSVLLKQVNNFFDFGFEDSFKLRFLKRKVELQRLN